MDELRRLISTEMGKQGLSFRTAAARSSGLISYSHLSVIASGRHTGSLDDRTLKGIALALDVPVSKVRKAYGTTSTEPFEFVLPDKAKYLTGKEREAVLAMVDAFLSGRKRTNN